MGPRAWRRGGDNGFPNQNNSAADRFIRPRSDGPVALSIDKPEKIFYKLQCMPWAPMEFMYFIENPEKSNKFSQKASCGHKYVI